MASHKETICTKDLIDSLKEQGCWSYKIPDAGQMHGRRPFDMIACCKGKFVATELKWYERLRPFGIKELSPHQIDELIKVKEAGGIALVGLFVKPKGISKMYRLYMWDIFELVEKVRLTTQELREEFYIEAERVTRGNKKCWRFVNITLPFTETK